MVNNMNYSRNAHKANNNRMAASNNVSCEELMRAIMEADFFAMDLKLYLNTHPWDKRALEMYNEACKQYKACKAAFEDSFYPLTACSAGREDCWDWLDGVWPPKSF